MNHLKKYEILSSECYKVFLVLELIYKKRSHTRKTVSLTCGIFKSQTHSEWSDQHVGRDRGRENIKF